MGQYVLGNLQRTIFLEPVKGPGKVEKAMEMVGFCDKVTNYLLPPEMAWVSMG